MSDNIFELKTEKGEHYLTISLDKNDHILYLDWNWKEDYGIECIKTGCILTLELLEENQLDGGIANLKKVDGNWQEASIWIQDVWLPKALEAGIKRWIFIRSDDYFSELSANHLDKGLALKGFLTHNVRTLEEAKSFLDFPTN